MFDEIEHTSKYCAASVHQSVAVSIGSEAATVSCPSATVPCPSLIGDSRGSIVCSPVPRPHMVHTKGVWVWDGFMDHKL